MTKLMESLIVSFYQGLSLVQVSTSFHLRNLRFQGGVQIPLLNYLCTKCEGLRLDCKFYVFCVCFINSICQKYALETYLQMYFYHSKYLAFLRSQICSFPTDEFTNVPTWRENSNNQLILTMSSDKFHHHL